MREWSFIFSINIILLFWLAAFYVQTLCCFVILSCCVCYCSRILFLVVTIAGLWCLLKVSVTLFTWYFYSAFVGLNHNILKSKIVSNNFSGIHLVIILFTMHIVILIFFTSAIWSRLLLFPICASLILYLNINVNYLSLSLRIIIRIKSSYHLIKKRRLWN